MSKATGKPVTKETAAYCFSAILQYMNGDIDKFKELRDKALNFEKETNTKAVKCKYVKGGKKIDAFINFATGEIKDTKGFLLKQGVGVQA